MVNVRLLCTCFAGFGASVSSFAQLWDGGAGTSAYGTAANWNPDVVPGNVVLTFDGAVANNQYTINLGATRTVAGLIFINATGTNPFTFQNNQFTLGSSGIVNNDADTQTFSSGLSLLLSANQTWNAAAGQLMVDGSIDANGKALTISGPNNVTFSGDLLGSGSLIKQGTGTLLLDSISGNYTGGLTVQDGTMYVKYVGSLPVPNITTVTGGLLHFEPTVDFQGFSAAVSINGGSIKLAPMDEITSILNGGALTLGANGGVLDLSSRLATGVNLGATTVNSGALTPATIRYGTIANSASGSFGWDTAGRNLNIANGNLSGMGALKFELSDGAMVNYSQGTFAGSMTFSGVSGGNAGVGSSGTTVGRLALSTAATFTFTGGLTFENAMQVTGIGGGRTIDANITIVSGETAFQGRSGGVQDLTIGSTVGGRTLTVKDGAAATFDDRFRTESSLNTIGGVTLNANTVLEAGGSLNFRKSATVAGENVNPTTVNGDITGQGTTAKESTIRLGVTSGNGGVDFANGAGTSGSDLIINGSGLGGLRLEGAQAAVDNLLTTARIQDITGTGGTLTIAYSDNVTKNFVVSPTAASNVRLGFDSLDGSSPVYQIGAAVNDLTRWGGLVVKGGTVRTMFNESFTGSASQTTSLDLTGGNLILNSGSQARVLTFEGGANLTSGVLDGGASAGTLVIGGDLTHGSATLANSPNITMSVSVAATISGNDIIGVGNLTKQGVGTVTLQTGITATRIDIQAGTLLIGGDNLIGDATTIRLGGGTLGLNGKSDTVGALTLAANSTIDFGSSGSSAWIFGDSSSATWTGGTVLTIANWDGQWNGGGSDQLIFGGLGAGQVSQIRFLNPGGTTGLFNARILPTGEIVPVPEPATIGFGALLLGSLGVRERKRLANVGRYFRGLLKKCPAS